MTRMDVEPSAATFLPDLPARDHLANPVAELKSTRLTSLVLALALASCGPRSGEPQPASDSPPLRALGILDTLDTPADCSSGRCTAFRVASPDLAEAAAGRMVVDDPSGEVRGTVVLFTGADGRWIWGETPWNGGGDRHAAVLDTLRGSGFRVVRVAWDEGWLQGATGAMEGYAALACRPATAIAWIAGNLTEPGTPLCIGGGSGGAAQVSYALTHYGLADRLSLVVPWSGFWMGRVDAGCLGDGLRDATLVYGTAARRAADATFGFGSFQDVMSGREPDAPGPCERGDLSARRAFEDASISVGGDYDYPTTLVWHILAGADELGALAQGHTYYEAMVRAGSPHVQLDILPGAPHNLEGVDAGLELIRDVFLAECRLR